MRFHHALQGLVRVHFRGKLVQGASLVSAVCCFSEEIVLIGVWIPGHGRSLRCLLRCLRVTSSLIFATVWIVHLTIYHVVIALDWATRHPYELSLQPNIHNVHVYIYSVFILSTILCALRHLVQGSLRAQGMLLVLQLVVVYLHCRLVAGSWGRHFLTLQFLFRSPSFIVVGRNILNVTVVFPPCVSLREIVLSMHHARRKHRIQVLLVEAPVVG